MATYDFEERQELNAYVEMLKTIYGPTQNYSKSISEIYAHLAEVCGITGKHLFKKEDGESGLRFLPKIFGWAIALVNAVYLPGTDLESLILRKFPRVCPYCQEAKCACWSGEKPGLDESNLEKMFYNRASAQARGLNDFELMFASIYSHTWKGRTQDQKEATYIYLRLIEELAEVGEALRFHHIYPENLANELADLFAWWFALASVIRKDNSRDTLDDIMWRSYPGQCRDCESAPCFCPQGPVRELMSKPAPGRHRETDVLTGLRNQAAYQQEMERVGSGKLRMASPMACVRLDADKFKAVNDTYGHAAGDAALKHIGVILRQKARPRDRIYRISGDEFGILMPDTTAEEAFGVMRRVVQLLSVRPMPWTDRTGTTTDIQVSVSVGVAECGDPSSIAEAFERADKASYDSKGGSSGKVTVAAASSIQPA